MMRNILFNSLRYIISRASQLFGFAISLTGYLAALFTIWFDINFFVHVNEALAETRHIDIKPHKDGNRGQIAIVNRNGQTEIRLRGFSKPRTLSVSAEGAILVSDSGDREVTLVGREDDQYASRYSWKLSPDVLEPVAVLPEPNNSLLVVDRGGAVVRLDSNSVSQTLSKAPSPSATFTSAAPLQDGRVLIAKADGTSPSTSIKIFDSKDTSWTNLSVQEMQNEERVIPTFVATLGASVYLWRPGTNTIFQGKVEGTTFIPSKAFHTQAPFLVLPNNTGGLSYVTFDGAIIHLSNSEQKLGGFQFINQPSAVGLTPDANHLIFAHEFPQSVSWPEVEDKLFSHARVEFNWQPVFIFSGIALITTLVWLTITLRLSHCKKVNITTSDVSLWVEKKRAPWKRYTARILGLITTTVGLYLATLSHQKLLNNQPRANWLPGYLLGAILVAIGVEVWRRLFPGSDEPERFASMIRRPAPRFSWSNAIPLSAIVCLAVYIYTMGVSRTYIGTREGAFFAGLILACGVIARETIENRKALLAFISEESVFFVPPLLVGVVTFFYRLTEIPYNCHFDYTLNAFFSGQFLKGKFYGWWDWGYVPAPVIGTIPEILGFILAGWTPLGYRLGNSLFNISGIFAVYLLGRVYRNPRVGFWAALILAGNVPFIHFGRLHANGSSATTALWALAMFVLALKHKRTSLWLLTGIVCGFSFYQWPVARVGLTAVGCFYLLLLLRHPITQIKQLPHLLSGAIGFGLMLAPFIIMWQVYPERLMPRADASMTGVKWEGTWFKVASEHPTVQLFYRSLGWIFNEFDRSSQGTISPGFNSVEAILFACGLAIMFIEGLSLNILLAILLTITLLVCGALAVGPPWYTRVLPTAPVACIIIGRVLEGVHNLLRFANKKNFWAIFAFSACCLIVVSPYTNFRNYVNYESAVGQTYRAHPMVAIARYLYARGPQSRYVWLAAGEPQWQFRNVPSFTVMLPYIHGLVMKEVYAINDELPVKPGSPTTFLVQLKRRDLDIPDIRKVHPDAIVEDIKDINGELVAIAVRVR
jgi:hypothetical protein